MSLNGTTSVDYWQDDTPHCAWCGEEAVVETRDDYRCLSCAGKVRCECCKQAVKAVLPSNEGPMCRACLDLADKKAQCVSCDCWYSGDGTLCGDCDEFRIEYNRHWWTVGMRFESMCRDADCRARMTPEEAERRLNAFDALVEALEWTTTTLRIMQEAFAERGSPPSNAPTVAALIAEAEATLALARGESEVRA